jgi:hypothetical protein
MQQANATESFKKNYDNDKIMIWESETDRGRQIFRQRGGERKTDRQSDRQNLFFHLTQTDRSLSLQVSVREGFEPVTPDFLDKEKKGKG